VVVPVHESDVGERPLDPGGWPRDRPDRELDGTENNPRAATDDSELARVTESDVRPPYVPVALGGVPRVAAPLAGPRASEPGADPEWPPPPTVTEAAAWACAW
jgi:hypothetical protein